MANQEIREYAKSKNVRHWEIAYRLGIGDCWFSRLMRREFSTDKKERVLSIIDQIVSERNEVNA